MNFKRLICAGMAGVMLANTSIFCASADSDYKYHAISKNSYYKWVHPDDYETQPHITGYYSLCDDGKYTIWVEHETNSDEFIKKTKSYNGQEGYKYKLQLKENGKWKNVYTGKGDIDHAVLTGLKAYTSYTIRIYIPHYGDYWFNKDGKKAYSESIVVKTVPAKSKIVSATSSKNAVRLNWKRVRCEGYKIQQKKGTRWVTVKTIKDSNITTARIPKLRMETKYSFRIKTYGKTAKTYPVYENDSDPIQDPHYTHDLWSKPSKVVTVKTKK